MAGGNKHLAFGYWGRDLHCRLVQDQIADKEKELLADQLFGAGRAVTLYQPIPDDYEGAVPCTCDKNTRPASDHRCYSCYGRRLVPGYTRFQHELIFWSSAESDDWTLGADCVLDTEVKPHRVLLRAGALTGTFTTNDKPFLNPAGLPWARQYLAYPKTPTDTILVEFSIDGGATWADINTIGSVAGPGNMRLRVTMTRVSAATQSPDFEIARIRRAEREHQTARAKKTKRLDPGEIFILRTWAQERTLRNPTIGRQTEWLADKAWTTDLAFFDKRIEENSRRSVVFDRDAGPHPFYVIDSGIGEAERCPIEQVSWNAELLDTLTHQEFLDRRAQSGEAYFLIW